MLVRLIGLRDDHCNHFVGKLQFEVTAMKIPIGLSDIQLYPHPGRRAHTTEFEESRTCDLPKTPEKL